MGCSQVVRQRFLVACTVGSNPTTPATLKIEPISYFNFCFTLENSKIRAAYAVTAFATFEKHILRLI